MVFYHKLSAIEMRDYHEEAAFGEEAMTHAGQQLGPAANRTGTANGEVPANLVYAGVIVGLVLIFLGIGLLSFGRGSVLSSLMTCVGFGLVLASFGARAEGIWAGWTVTGAGALAIVLFLVLQYVQPSPPPLIYKKGQLRGDLSKIADLRIIDELPMYEYRDRTTSSIRFILLDKKLKSGRLSIQVDTTEKGFGQEFFELIGDANIIEARYLSDRSGDDKQIQWTFDYDRRVVKDGPDVIFSEQDSLQDRLVPTKRSGFLEWLPGPDSIISRASAQSVQSADQTTPLSDLISALRSDDTSARRNARDDLAARGPSAVGEMMAALRASPSDYRIRLGVLFAVSDILRRSPDQRSAISAALTDSDFPILVAAASDDDKTIRLQAAEFLYLLQDSRAVAPSIDAARQAVDASKATNQVLIIRESAQTLDQSEKKKVVNDLVKSPGPNNSVVRSIESLGKLGIKW